jgi:hypothetical protein
VDQFELKRHATWNGISNRKAFWASACHSLLKWQNREVHEENYQRPIQPHMKIARYANNYGLAVKLDNIVTALPNIWVHIKWRPREGI